MVLAHLTWGTLVGIVVLIGAISMGFGLLGAIAAYSAAGTLSVFAYAGLSVLRAA
ncbi:MAG: hypothetical protein AAGF88_06655 [Pseudomonadota bacterium]